MLEVHKANILEEAARFESMGLPEEAKEKLLLRASTLSFYNTSKMDLSTLGASGIKDNLESYIQSFSPDAREIFEHFKFGEFIAQLSDANLLDVLQKVLTKLPVSTSPLVTSSTSQRLWPLWMTTKA